jgi:hypothetical protein
LGNKKDSREVKTQNSTFIDRPENNSNQLIAVRAVWAVTESCWKKYHPVALWMIQEWIFGIFER